MNYRLRNRIFYGFAIIFIIGSIATCLYAAGYRLVLSWPLNPNDILQKTGMLVIKSNPSKAQLTLEKTRSRELLSFLKKESESVYTPKKIKNLLPGEYKITLNKSGYWSWGKKINIKAGESVYLEDINLFKKTLPTNVYKTKLQNIVASPNFDKILLTNDKKIIDLNSQTVNQEIKSPQDLKDCHWEENNNYLVTDGNLISLNETGTSSKVSQYLEENIKNLQIKNNKIYYNYNNSINCFDLKNYSNEKLILGNNILDYLIKDSRIYTLSSENNKTYFNIYDENQNPVKEIELPFSLAYEFKELNNQYINVYNPEYETLYLLMDNKLFTTIKSVEDIKNIKWMKNDQFIYSNNFEIFLYDLKEKQKTLINRVSKPITNLLWNGLENYLIYTTDKEINLIELEPSRYNKVVNLITLEKIKSPLLDKKEEIIYFTAKIGNSSGLYKLYLD